MESRVCVTESHLNVKLALKWSPPPLIFLCTPYGVVLFPPADLATWCSCGYLENWLFQQLCSSVKNLPNTGEKVWLAVQRWIRSMPYCSVSTEFHAVLKNKYLFPVWRVLVKSLFAGVVECFREIDRGVELELLVPALQPSFWTKWECANYYMKGI